MHLRIAQQRCACWQNGARVQVCRVELAADAIRDSARPNGFSTLLRNGQCVAAEWTAAFGLHCKQGVWRSYPYRADGKRAAYAIYPYAFV